MNYFLQGYDREGNPTDDKRRIVIEKFPPELSVRNFFANKLPDALYGG